jgi:hypothetical protein
MDSQKLMISRGEVVAIGEFKFRNSEEFPYEVPRLSYLIVKEAENTYASTCIDLHIDGDGITPDEAEANMGENVFEFLCTNFIGERSAGPAWNYLNELFEIDDNSRELWNVFSKFKIELAKTGKNADAASEFMELNRGLNEEIEILQKLDLRKEGLLRKAYKRIIKQKEVIDRLNKEKLEFQLAANISSHLLKNYEYYYTSSMIRR